MFQRPTVVHYMGYPTYSSSRYTFRKAIQDETSWIRKMIRELEEFGTVTKLEFFTRHVPHVIEDGKVRPGWGSSIWCALQEVGLIEKSKFRRDRYPVMIHGPRYNELFSIANYFKGRTLTWEEIQDARDEPTLFLELEDWGYFYEFFDRKVPRRKWVYPSEDEGEYSKHF